MFGNRYCDLKKNHFGRLDWKGHSNLAELQYLLRLTNMIRREKDAVLDQLPAKIRTEIHLSITDSEKKLLDADLKKMKDRFRSLDDIDNAGMGSFFYFFGRHKESLKKNKQALLEEAAHQ